MRITIYNNGDGTYHVGIIDKNSFEDSTLPNWEAVLALLAILKPV